MTASDAVADFTRQMIVHPRIESAEVFVCDRTRGVARLARTFGRGVPGEIHARYQAA